MCFQGFQHILRTCGLITAVAPQPRRNRELIKANQHHKRKYDYFLKQNFILDKNKLFFAKFLKHFQNKNPSKNAIFEGKWFLQESNQGHTDFQSVALPTELRNLFCLIRWQIYEVLS